MDNKWIFAIISTDYDLSDERRAIIDFLREKNCIPSAFEEPDFPVQDRVHSHDNCIAALTRADFAILIIKERYGGRYYFNSDISITQAEYDALDIPTIVLVNKKTWDERALYRRMLKASGLDEDAFAASGRFPQGKIEIDTIRFVNKIQNAYETTGRSNWINFWDNLKDLIEQLPSILSARCATVLETLLSEQIKEVKRRRTSTSFSLALGEVFEKKYYLEPVYTVSSGEINESETLASAINQKLEDNDSCLILGEAGAGKTTLVAKCFLEAASSHKDNLYSFPIYVWLKHKKADSEFSIIEYFKESCSHYLSKLPYPFFDQNGFQFTFFFDGFDELAEKLTAEELKHIYTSEMFQYPLVLTCRNMYADHYINSPTFTSKFSCHIRLNDWTSDMASDYITQFCNLQHKDETLKAQIKKLLIENEENKDVITSPLLITILLFVIENEGVTNPETIKTKTQVFAKCIDRLAIREIEKNYEKWGSIPDKEDLVLHWAHFAWIIYENRLQREDLTLLQVVEEKLEARSAIHWPSTTNEVIFDIHGDHVVGPIHEQFLEFLVARELVYACLEKKEPYPDFLKYIMRPEINRYFRGLVSTNTLQNQKQIFENIKSLYRELCGDNTEVSILMRVHAVYHLSRLFTIDNYDEISRIFSSESEAPVLQSLYFGVIKKGYMDREQEFYNLLEGNPEYNNSNRGYHIAYYDIINGAISLPYTDNKDIIWNGTLRAFHRHFSSPDIEHYRLRRIDLLTMRQLMEFRGKVEPLNDEEILFFEQQSHIKIDGIDNAFVHLVEDEFEKMRSVYNRLSAT